MDMKYIYNAKTKHPGSQNDCFSIYLGSPVNVPQDAKAESELVLSHYGKFPVCKSCFLIVSRNMHAEAMQSCWVI